MGLNYRYSEFDFMATFSDFFLSKWNRDNVFPTNAIYSFIYTADFAVNQANALHSTQKLPAITLCSKPHYLKLRNLKSGNLVSCGVRRTSSGLQSGPRAATQLTQGCVPLCGEKPAGTAGPASGRRHICREDVRRDALGSAQPEPRGHHFLWVSHRVLPLLHCFWDGAVESQMHLPETKKRWDGISLLHLSVSFQQMRAAVLF